MSFHYKMDNELPGAYHQRYTWSITSSAIFTAKNAEFRVRRKRTGAMIDDPMILYIVFIVSVSVEQYFFMLQRSALEISRAYGIDVREGRRMLPPWYLAVWPTQIAKWAAAIYIGVQSSWIVAVLLLAATFIFHLFVPIPHRQFIPIFHCKLAKEIGIAVKSGSSIDSAIYSRLYKVLHEASKDPRFS